MLLIRCPWCSEREQTEFSYHGEAHIARPAAPMDQTDEQWGDYLFFRSNSRGPHRERWLHTAGCRRWFNLLRDTATGQILAVYRPDEPPPAATAG